MFSAKTSLAFIVLPFLLAPAFVSTLADPAPSLTGTWVTVFEKLDDGTDNKTYYQFEQTGDTVTGTVTYAWGVLHLKEGKVTGTHFHFVEDFGKNPFTADGEIVGNELHYTSNEYDAKPHPRVAHSSSESEIPKYARIELPAPKTVASNGAAKTPPMGWNSWNKFSNKVNDKLVREMADVMVSSGMRDAGYVYINIDDTWEGTRDAEGNLRPNFKFPDMKALADYVHARGLKIGVYSSPGPKTCGGYEGSYGHEVQDAKTLAAWGIDYLKYDWCSAGKIYDGKTEVPAVYQRMGQALADSGRPIVFSLCEYGMMDPWKWGAQVGGSLWRTAGDISDSWESMTEIGFSQSEVASYAGPGHWNDPDMLEVGNGGMTEDEYRTHMTLWSMLAAPLIAGNDLREMSASTKSILLNKEVIAIDQDALGAQGHRLSQSGDQEIWIKPLSGGAVAVALFNRSGSAVPMKVGLKELGIPPGVSVRDLWRPSSSVAPSNGELSATVPSHGVVALRVEPRAAQ